MAGRDEGGKESKKLLGKGQSGPPSSSLLVMYVQYVPRQEEGYQPLRASL